MTLVNGYYESKTIINVLVKWNARCHAVQSKREREKRNPNILDNEENIFKGHWWRLRNTWLRILLLGVILLACGTESSAASAPTHCGVNWQLCCCDQLRCLCWKFSLLQVVRGLDILSTSRLCYQALIWLISFWGCCDNRGLLGGFCVCCCFLSGWVCAVNRCGWEQRSHASVVVWLCRRQLIHTW